MSCIMICTMIFYNNVLQIFNEKQELFYSVLLYFCDSVFVFQCLCFLVIVQKCALVQFSHDLPMAKWQNCRWRRMAKLAKWAKWVKWAIRIAPILGSKHKTRNYFINSYHWNERIAYLHHKEILSNWNHLKMHCLLKFEHISWDSSEKSISCFQSLTNNSTVQTINWLKNKTEQCQ